MRTRAFLLTVLLATASGAGATQFQAFDRNEQVRASELIVVGRVESMRSAWDEAGNGIVTDVAIAIEETWKGSPDRDHLVVRTPGGTVDDVELVLDGAARFRPGERVVLFLERRGSDWRPWGMTFGKYSVEGRTDFFLVGNLPPTVTGAQSYEVVSIALEDLRREVETILEGNRP